MQDTTNKLFQLASSFVNFTDTHLFLTGRAGTGKTTFLKHIRENCKKNMVVTAPTGVAAINAGGVTLHSFFQLPFGLFIPEGNNPVSSFSTNNKNTLLANLRLSGSKRRLIEELELLIIDEISMVRCDLLDAVDVVMRYVRSEPLVPFGGVQVLLIGDLFQLPPVVKDDEKDLLGSCYKSPFFFDSKVMAQAKPLCLELKTIYRQNDEGFIELLNKVRNNALEEADFEELNKRYQPRFEPPADEHYIRLCSHNYQANGINEKELEKLPGKAYRFKASVEGDFNEHAFPADHVLQLKEGAQIMFIRNDRGEDRRFYNGKIAEIVKINEESIRVTFPGEADEMELEREEWNNIRYVFDEAKGEIEEETLGTFKQYPVRLAWAITIHKSQGLTFERAIIDAGQSFSPGQVYVALSRLTSMEGLVLHSLIQPRSIKNNDVVVSFMQDQPDEPFLENELKLAQERFLQSGLMKTYDWRELTAAFHSHAVGASFKAVPRKEDASQMAFGLLEKCERLEETGKKFIQQLEKLMQEKQAGKIRERIDAGTAYFMKEMTEELLHPLSEHIQKLKKEKTTKKYLKALHTLLVRLEFKKHQLSQSLILREAFNGKDSLAILEEAEKQKEAIVLTQAPEPVKKEKGDSQRFTLELFRAGKTAEEIAKERGLVTGTIEGHLAQFVRTGEVSVFELLDEASVKEILPYVSEESNSSSTVKAMLGDKYTYAQIRAVINHWYRLHAHKDEKAVQS